MFRFPSRKTPLCIGEESRAFTLIELLAVIALIAVLAALLVGSISKIRDIARRSTCTSNLRQIGAAFQLYAADNHGLFPAARLLREGEMPTPYTKANPPPWTNPSLENWPIEISRYIIRDQNLGQIKATGADTNIGHCPCYDLLFPSLANLSANYQSTAGYGMNANLNVGGLNYRTMFKTGPASDPDNTWYGLSHRLPAASLNNPAKTVLVGDSSNFHILSSYPGSWDVATITDPTNPKGQPDGYTSGAPKRHGDTANYVFVDGHVATLTPDVASQVTAFHP